MKRTIMPNDLFISRRKANALMAGFLVSVAYPSYAQNNEGNTSKTGKISIGKAELDVQTARAILRSDLKQETSIWSLDGTIQGPILRAKPNEICTISIHNKINLPLSLHWHGARIDNAMDGVGGLTQAPIQPGERFTYQFRPSEPGTSLIRPCVIGSSSELVGRGLTGLLIVEEETPPLVDLEYCAIVNDWLLDETGQLKAFEPMPAGRLGNALSINGAPIPLVLNAKAGSRVRLRLANTCSARSFRIRFDRLKAFVIAIDGQPTDAFEPLRSSLPFNPGNRYDIVFDMPAYDADAALIAMIGNGIKLISISSSEKGEPKPNEVEPLKANPKLPLKIRLQDAIRQNLTFGMLTDNGTGRVKGWTINNIPGQDQKKPLFSVKQGSPVVLTIRNDTPLPQPFHIHGHCFRLLHPFDDGWDPFWLDTMLIPNATTQRIAFIAGTPGKWMMASSVCERFDSGLWTWFEVI